MSCVAGASPAGEGTVRDIAGWRAVVAAAAIASLAPRAEALDPFKCYRSQDRTSPPFAPATVALDDDFDVDDGNFTLEEPSVFCNPTDLDGTIAHQPNDHLTCHKIVGTRIPKAERPRIEVTNELGTSQLELYKASYACIATKEEKTALRQACAFDSGALPEDTLDLGQPHGEAIPIDHIVMLMQENRSFDHYFGRLPAAGHANVDGLPPGASNPDAMDVPVPSTHMDQYCVDDVSHSWNGSHTEYDNGANDGFVIANDPGGERAMGYLEEADLPFYYGVAKTFSMADRFFCSLLGPTYPNRFYYMTGTSDGRINNQLAVFTRPSILNRLETAGVSYKIYAAQIAFAFLLSRPQRPLSEFFSDAAAGTLPPVSYIDPAFAGENENDEHPPSNPQRGQQFTESIYNAIVNSPNWPTTALIISYDEHGGFYDHVPPPPACKPDDVPPALTASSYVAEFDRYGFRVPLIVVSPYSRPGYVSHQTFDLTSILRFVEARFDIPALTARDANATPITEMFDFSKPPQLLAPPAQPPAVIDPGQDAICATFS
jgi:phospholipase C